MCWVVYTTWNKQHNNTETEVDAVNQPVFGGARQTGVSLTGWISKVLFKLQLSVPILVLFLSSDTDLMCEGPILLPYSEGPKKHQSGGAIASNCIFLAGKLLCSAEWCNSFCHIEVITGSCWNCLTLTAPNNLRVYNTILHFNLCPAFLGPLFHANMAACSCSVPARIYFSAVRFRSSRKSDMMVNKRKHHSCCVCVAVTWGFGAGGLGANIWKKGVCMAHKGMDIGWDLNIKSCEAQWNGTVIWAQLRLEGSGFI